MELRVEKINLKSVFMKIKGIGTFLLEELDLDNKKIPLKCLLYGKKIK